MILAVEAKLLTKKFGDLVAVNQIELAVKKGECFGILGPRGAGKSSTLKMIYCSALPTSGELFVLGYNTKSNEREIKSKIGVIPQDDGLDPDFSVFDNLTVYARYHGLNRIDAEMRAKEMLDLVRMEEFADRHVDTLTIGLRRRLVTARALLNRPELLILDEPTAGVDAQSRTWAWEFLKRKRSEGMTSVISTFYISEAEAICDRVAIMNGGKILAIDEPQTMIKEEIGREVVEFESSTADLEYFLKRLKENSYEYQVIKNRVCVFIKQKQDGREAMNLISSHRVTVRKPGLNDVFLKLAGHDLQDA